MPELWVIGIGMGTPAHLTLEAAEAIRRCDAFLVADKGTTPELVAARRAVVAAVRGSDGYRFVTVADPERPSDGDPVAPRYRQGVASWRQARAEANVAAMADLADDAVVGFLAWGDPAFYDSTIQMAHDVAALRPSSIHVVAGLSAFQILAAHAGVGLNLVSGAVHVMPGRHLVDAWRPELGTVVVMLDSHLRVAELAADHPDLEIVWGGNLGLESETVVTGLLGDVIDEIADRRASLRGRLGWVMDTYAIWPAHSGIVAGN